MYFWLHIWEVVVFGATWCTGEIYLYLSDLQLYVIHILDTWCATAYRVLRYFGLPTGSHKSIMRLTSVRRFPFLDTGPELAQGQYAPTRKSQAQPGTLCDAYVRLPVAQGQGMRSPPDEHHPNRTSSVSGNEYAQNVSSINGKSMLISGGAAGGYVKQCPTGAIFPQKCGRWYFQNAVGRENPAKARPLDTQNAVQRARRTIESHQHHLSVPCSPLFSPVCPPFSPRSATDPRYRARQGKTLHGSLQDATEKSLFQVPDALTL